MNAESANAVPPKIAPRSLNFLLVAAFAVAIAGALVILFFFDPIKNKYGFYPPCAFHQLTGLNCPGCGATRGIYALLHGNIVMALHDNALAILTLMAVLIWLTRIAIAKIRGRKIMFAISSKVFWIFLALAIVFAVLRNLPAFRWLSP